MANNKHITDRKWGLTKIIQHIVPGLKSEGIPLSHSLGTFQNPRPFTGRGFFLPLRVSEYTGGVSSHVFFPHFRSKTVLPLLRRSSSFLPFLI